LDDQALAVFRDQVSTIIWGTVFSFAGLAACAIAAARRSSGVRILIWLGIWSGMYGMRMLLATTAVTASLPRWLQPAVPYVDVTFAYLLVVFALLAWLELSRGPVRRALQALAAAGTAVGIAGIGGFLVTGSPGTFILYNNLVAVTGLLILVTVVIARPLSDRSLILGDHRILAAGTLVFAVEALYSNLARSLHLWHTPALDSAGFAALLLAFASVAAGLIFSNERRLLSIESELETARRIQTSILPACVPDVDGARLAAAYRPMTAVAGDFYDFCVVDRQHFGVLVADVTGHGVPAALVASMIKIAIRSVASCAQDPGQVLHELNRVLSDVLRGQYVTAAYVWIDAGTLRARYSAAGHPPLLHWSAASGELRPIQSNGILFGVLPDTQYPVHDLQLAAGDRLLLYTDGLIEPENAGGEPFGDTRLEQVVREGRSVPAGELSTRLLDELHAWQSKPGTQQDDITLVVIDVE
jgi:phosphoserine phosphatase RsbU/P